MCYWQIAMAAVQTVSQVGSQMSQTKSMMKAHQLNVEQEIKQNNIANANMRMQQVDMMMGAREQLTELSFEQQRALGSLNLAFGESGLEGKSFDRIKNSLAISTEQKKSTVRYNLQKDYAGMYAEALGNTLSMQQRIRAREAQLPSRTQQAWGVFGSAMQNGGQAYASIQASGGGS